MCIEGFRHDGVPSQGKGVNMRVAVTGANGFVGRPVTANLCDAGHALTALVRRAGGCDPRANECVIPDDNFASIAAGTVKIDAADVLVHLAARVHVMKDSAADPLAQYRAANVEGTLNTARAALRAGVKRIVFVSSIKALGEREPGHPWRETDLPAPTDPYGITKLEAERLLVRFGQEHGIEAVVLRPPLVYGPGVRANFEALMKAVDRGFPLPLGAIDAQRSMVSSKNLADAIRFLATRPEPTEGIFHVTDGDDFTVAQMIQALARALGKRAHLVAVPVSWLRAAGRLIGRSPQVERLTSPLRLDSTRLREGLGWQPPFTVEQGLADTARALREAR
jgi:nucleoside-diphosphate-sugar epimerase